MCLAPWWRAVRDTEGQWVMLRVLWLGRETGIWEHREKGQCYSIGQKWAGNRRPQSSCSENSLLAYKESNSYLKTAGRGYVMREVLLRGLPPLAFTDWLSGGETWLSQACSSSRKLLFMNLTDRVFLQFCGLSLTTLQAIACMQCFEECQGVPMFHSSHIYASFSYAKLKINWKDRIFKAFCEVFNIAVQGVDMSALNK